MSVFGKLTLYKMYTRLYLRVVEKVSKHVANGFVKICYQYLPRQNHN